MHRLAARESNGDFFAGLLTEEHQLRLVVSGAGTGGQQRMYRNDRCRRRQLRDRPWSGRALLPGARSNVRFALAQGA
jgi:hypothetical protein